MSEPCTRINAEIPKRLAERLDAVLFWGAKSRLIRSLLELAMDAVDEHGVGVLKLIVDKRYNPLTKTVLEEKESK